MSTRWCPSDAAQSRKPRLTDRAWVESGERREMVEKFIFGPYKEEVLEGNLKQISFAFAYFHVHL